MASLDDVLLPVFATQHWLVSMDDILRHGGHAQSATRRVQSGRWEAVDRAVFRLAGAPRPWHSTVLAPILSAGGRAMASHFAAAALHGIPGYGHGTPEITHLKGHRAPALRTSRSTPAQTSSGAAACSSTACRPPTSPARSSTSGGGSATSGCSVRSSGAAGQTGPTGQTSSPPWPTTPAAGVPASDASGG